MNAHVNEHSAHAVYAPSAAHRWTKCTASARAIAALGEQEEGDAAKEGTEAHEEIERVLGPYSGDGMGFWLERENTMVNPLDRDHPAAYGVNLVLRYVRGLTPGKLWIEQRVHLTEHIWGRCDVAHWDDATCTLTIVDYKNGFVGVDAEENEQLRIYGAGSIYTHKLPAKWVRYVVVQPNDFRPVPRVKQWVESAESLYEWANRIAAIPFGKLDFVAGEQCTYCPMFGLCPASRDMLVQLSAVIGNQADAVPMSKVAPFIALKKPIEDWFKALDKAQTKAALQGNVPPGMKLVRTSKHRTWKDEGAARDVILAAHGPNALLPPTPAQAEKLGGIDVDALSDKPEGGPALAFESDKRPRWEPPSAEKMFAGVVGPTR